MKKIPFKHKHFTLMLAAAALTIVAGSSVKTVVNADEIPGVIKVQQRGNTMIRVDDATKDDASNTLDCVLTVQPLEGIAPLTVTVMGKTQENFHFVALHR